MDNHEEHTSLLVNDQDDDESRFSLMEAKAKLAWQRAKEKGFSYCSSFKKFVNSRGDILSLAVALIVASNFNTIVQSLVDDILMPPFGLLPGANLQNWFIVLKHGTTTNMTYTTIEQAQNDGAVTENIGLFLVNVINFIIIAVLLWLLVMLATGIKEKIQIQHDAINTKMCSECKETIKIEATRCKWCTSEVQ